MADVAGGTVVASGPPRAGGRRAKVLLRHVGTALITLFLISVVAFAAGSYRPGEDVARSSLGRDASQAQIDSFVQQYGLDGPLVSRYGKWLGSAVQGDWGTSPVTKRPISEDVLPRFRDTTLLAGLALLVGIPLSIMFGVVMASARNRAGTLLMSVVAVVLASLPEFVFGGVALLVLSAWLGWLPVTSQAIGTGTFAEQALAFALPVLTLVVAVLPHVSRITAAAVGETLRKNYVQTALLRGVPRRRVLRTYALRNAGVPVANAVGVNVVYLLSGVIVVENLFAFPGIGQYLVQAVQTGDALTIQAIAILMGAFFILTGMVVDFVSAYLNPRLKKVAS